MLDPRMLQGQLEAMDGMLELLGDQAEKLTKIGDDLARIRTEFAAAIAADDRFALATAAWQALDNSAATRRWTEEWAPMLRRVDRLTRAASGKLVPLPKPPEPPRAA